MDENIYDTLKLPSTAVGGSFCIRICIGSLFLDGAVGVENGELFEIGDVAAILRVTLG